MSTATDTKLAERVYGNYKTALRAEKRRVSAEGAAAQVAGQLSPTVDHAAVRRANARAAVAARHHLTEQEVRIIVRDMDAEVGVVHTYPMAEFIAAQKELDANPRLCKCGSGEQVFAFWNPFELNVNNEYKLVIGCQRDVEQLEDEI
jgi:hypothetical protein